MFNCSILLDIFKGFLFTETEEALLGDDDVVDEVDSHKGACLAQPVREPDVSLARPGVTAGMVVQKDDSSRVVEQGLPQHRAAVD